MNIRILRTFLVKSRILIKKKLFLFQYGMKRKGQHAGWGRRSGDTWFKP